MTPSSFILPPSSFILPPSSFILPPSLVPLGHLLVLVGDAQNRSLGERLADDLHADGQAVARHTTGNGDGRVPREVEGQRQVEVRPHQRLGALRQIGGLLSESRGDQGRGGCYQAVDLGKHLRPGRADNPPRAL